MQAFGRLRLHQTRKFALRKRDAFFEIVEAQPDDFLHPLIHFEDPLGDPLELFLPVVFVKPRLGDVVFAAAFPLDAVDAAFAFAGDLKIVNDVCLIAFIVDAVRTRGTLYLPVKREMNAVENGALAAARIAENAEQTAV